MKTLSIQDFNFKKVLSQIFISTYRAISSLPSIVLKIFYVHNLLHFLSKRNEMFLFIVYKFQEIL